MKLWQAQLRAARTRGGAAPAWWPAGTIIAYQAKGAASLAASYVNLANPGTYDGTTAAAPSFDAATGWTFNGSTYIDTGWAPPLLSGLYTLLCRFSAGATDGTRACCGAGQPGLFLSLRPAQGGKRTYLNGGFLYDYTAVSSGVIGLAGQKAFLNGAKEAGAITSASTSGGYGALQVGCEATGVGLRGNYYSGQIQAIALVAGVLSDSDYAALSAAMAAL